MLRAQGEHREAGGGGRGWSCSPPGASSYFKVAAPQLVRENPPCAGLCPGSLLPAELPLFQERVHHLEKGKALHSPLLNEPRGFR